ncbi:MAG TPA: hypothetical protein VNU23_02445 [Candidatus Cybelea sp.]|jgi:hypothetical protein|nr:hypothetical protein [Candidatus Cybelea sp.]
MADTMQNDTHLGAAEFHQLAAETRRDFTASRQKDDLRVDEHPKPTMQQAKKALERLPAANRKSV